ncbi:MAG: Papain-like cysteine protease AvrRpt2 [Acidobacteria bacterium OLB17]|nr:MAG: Papain-like cysteine protease AvrRpt2 [Acidobacteria bacterium OLB17]MCZ2390988.1 hypothetical protein [Acidobacteriota bacterium]
MGIYKVQNLQIVAQPTDAVCWWASDTMLYNWSKATGRGSMIDPLSDAGFKARYDSNGTWGSGDNKFMAKTLKMVEIASLDLTYDGLVAAFMKHGPIFASLQKNWGGNDYGHAVVFGGVADTGVLVYDPMPVGKGSLIWLTWAQTKKALDVIKDVANPAFLAAV